MDRMSALDAGFLQIENETQHLHVGSALVFEGPAPTYEQLRDTVESRLASVPRYHQRAVRLPLDLVRPVWVDDPHFEVSYHVRHTALPPPGDDAHLRALAARLMAQHLDRNRPLWELWFVEGLEGGRWAIVNKVHHAMIDGVSGHDLLEVILDRSPVPAPLPVPVWNPRPAPSTPALVARGAVAAVEEPLERLRTVVSGLRHPLELAGGAVSRVAGLLRVGGQAVRPEGVLNGPIGPHRRWGWAHADLADAKAVKAELGGTLNDVVLAAISGGFRRFLAARGEEVDGRTIRSMVPVSVRPPEMHGRLGNQVTAMFADLPVGIADPVQRLRAVTSQMDRLKRSGVAVGVEAMVQAADFVPPTLLSLGARVYARAPQRIVSTVTTNVPGPQFPLYFAGRQMLEMYPYIPLGEQLRITIGIVSYNGSIAIGATGDYDAVPDVDVLCAGIQESFAELLDAARAAAVREEGGAGGAGEEAPPAGEGADEGARLESG